MKNLSLCGNLHGTDALSEDDALVKVRHVRPYIRRQYKQPKYGSFQHERLEYEAETAARLFILNNELESAASLS